MEEERPSGGGGVVEKVRDTLASAAGALGLGGGQRPSGQEEFPAVPTHTPLPTSTQRLLEELPPAPTHPPVPRGGVAPAPLRCGGRTAPIQDLARACAAAAAWHF